MNAIHGVTQSQCRKLILIYCKERISDKRYRQNKPNQHYLQIKISESKYWGQKKNASSPSKQGWGGDRFFRSRTSYNAIE